MNILPNLPPPCCSQTYPNYKSVSPISHFQQGVHRGCLDHCALYFWFLLLSLVLLSQSWFTIWSPVWFSVWITSLLVSSLGLPILFIPGFFTWITTWFTNHLVSALILFITWFITWFLSSYMVYYSAHRLDLRLVQQLGHRYLGFCLVWFPTWSSLV